MRRFSQDLTAAEILAELLTVDGAGCLLDADKLDGNEASVFLTTSGGTLTGSITISSASPAYVLIETDQADDARRWATFSFNTDYYLQAQNDAGASQTIVWKIGRTGLITLSGGDSALLMPIVSAPTIGTNQAGLYSADQAAGNCCIHAKSEAGNVVKLFTGAAVADATDATSVIARLNDLLARMRANGLIAT